MASPWKLLAGLVSRRRQQKQEHGSTDDAKPDVLAIAKPTETADNNELDGADRPADEKPVLHGHSAAVPADPDHSEETASVVDDTTDVEGAKPVEASDRALSDEADTDAHVAPKAFRVVEGQTRKRGTRGMKAKTITVVIPPSPSALTASDDAINLDEEIRLLRDQLARKLQMQNEQLRRMLERFGHQAK
ncbi:MULTISPECIES: hypothetical protein [Rhizobium]|uniref:Uncharacterized protein n=1 Tax=Rhizobium leguminosarum bv. viciae TaxID=387 RepID=A0A8G2IT38_RHILV|nr:MULTISPECIES: hypothetical protein [Rhizobium]MBC2806913.1 hypothetical protein [Rhizobium ruizarguesonis]NKK10479.1 hypothetical protein [Rhizobium leguminosarum bv. viciae]NKK23633.1 hypothetical protein [Rhizobium leguminosarum bv. viciae]TBX85096.1 hypothetical protein E0H31_35570 [Rhizobium leguminosarum bv. viciae]TBY74069.1 hypothetical protein E0H32_31885 [Rhizobium leguminosarum bv. viciae]